MKKKKNLPPASRRKNTEGRKKFCGTRSICISGTDARSTLSSPAGHHSRKSGFFFGFAYTRKKKNNRGRMKKLPRGETATTYRCYIIRFDDTSIDCISLTYLSIGEESHFFIFVKKNEKNCNRRKRSNSGPMPSESNNRSESISLSRIVRNSSSIGDTKANLIIFVFGVCARVGGSHARAPFASASRRRGRGDSLVLAPAPIGSINGSWSVQQRAARLVASNHNKRAKVSGTCPLRQ